MNRDTIIQLAAAVVLIIGLIGSGALATAITSEAGRSQLTYTDEATDGDPPEVALGIAMGAFRGLFVNYLWIRANKLKEEGKFYEAIELSSAITRLQPRFPRVWIFHAWNMSYNISVATNTAPERWQWVSAGVNLLRDEAIPRNPNDVLLHRELAWIYVHKIQGYADDANHYYKRELAKEWTIILGEPPRLDGSSEQNMATMARWLRPVATAPDTLDGVIAEELAAQEARGDPLPPGGQRISKVAELANRIRTEARLDLDTNLLRFIELRRAWLNAWYVSESGYSNQLREGDYNIALDTLMADPQYEEAWLRLLYYVRKQVIIHKLNMEPQRMVRYTEEYGPLDWRHAGAHALYWAARGVDEGLERKGVTQFDTLNTDRLIMHAIQEMFRFGEVQYDLLTNEYYALNNFDWIDPYGKVLDKVMARGGLAADTQERVFTLYGAGYENLLKDVIRIYYNRGDLANAEKYHRLLRNWPGLNINDAKLIDELKLPLAEFVEVQLKDRLSTPQVAAGEMEAAITDAFLRGIVQGKNEIFRRQMEYAAKVREIYLQTQSTRTLADPEAVRMKQFVGESFAEPVAAVLLRLLSGGSFGHYRLGPQQAAYLYRRSPSAIQRIIYDDLSMAVQRMQGITPDVFGSMFPEPPGMQAFRDELAAMEARSDKSRRMQVEFEKDMTAKRFENQR